MQQNPPSFSRAYLLSISNINQLPLNLPPQWSIIDVIAHQPPLLGLKLPESSLSTMYDPYFVYECSLLTAHLLLSHIQLYLLTYWRSISHP